MVNDRVNGIARANKWATVDGRRGTAHQDLEELPYALQEQNESKQCRAKKSRSCETSRKMARHSRPMLSFRAPKLRRVSKGCRELSRQRGRRNDGRLRNLFLDRLQFQFFKEHRRGNHRSGGAE